MDTLKKKSGNKYLVFASTDKSKEVLEKYTELWDKIKYLIQTINDGEAGEYEKEYINLTIGVRSVFEEDGKYYQ